MYTEEQLISFGNYLFRRYNVHKHLKQDGEKEITSLAKVSDADFAAWEDAAKNPADAYFPSRFDIGDEAAFSIQQSFGANPYTFTVKILAVHFYPGKVKYDLEIPIEGEPPTRIYNIDSCFVLKISEVV